MGRDGLSYLSDVGLNVTAGVPQLLYCSLGTKPTARRPSGMKG